jgi:3-hydroxy-3-methylglutaryl CoA synthase
MEKKKKIKVQIEMEGYMMDYFKKQQKAFNVTYSEIFRAVFHTSNTALCNKILKRINTLKSPAFEEAFTPKN